MHFIGPIVLYVIEFFRTSRIGLTSVDYLVHRSCNHFTHLIEKCHNKNLSMVQLCRLALLAFVGVAQGQDRNLDRFNYDTTVRTDTYIDFGPEDWGDIRCPDLETCVSNQNGVQAMCSTWILVFTPFFSSSKTDRMG
jgi:hypothetical protein